MERSLIKKLRLKSSSDIKLRLVQGRNSSAWPHSPGHSTASFCMRFLGGLPPGTPRLGRLGRITPCGSHLFAYRVVPLGLLPPQGCDSSVLAQDLAHSRGFICCSQKLACLEKGGHGCFPRAYGIGIIALPELAPPLSWDCALGAGRGAEGLGPAAYLQSPALPHRCLLRPTFYPFFLQEMFVWGPTVCRHW